MSKIEVVLIDDHEIVRNGLKMFIEMDERIEVLGEASTMTEGMKVIDEKHPDLVLLDYRLPDGDGVNTCLNLKAKYPDLKVIMLTAYTDQKIAYNAIRAGCNGFLLKDLGADDFISTIHSVSDGKYVFNAELTNEEDQLKEDFDQVNKDLDHPLSQQESKILERIAQGKLNKEIADEMNLSEKTVRNYITNIFKKIDVTNRTEAAGFWFRMEKNRIFLVYRRAGSFLPALFKFTES